MADVHYGKSPKSVLDEDGDIPVLGTGGEYGRAFQSLFTGPAIIVPRKGSLGNPQYVGGKFWPVDTTYAVLPKRDVDARWLYYSLDLFDLTKLNEATGVPSISRDWLYKVPLSDADPSQQHSIAEIICTVDEAIEYTRALTAKTQQIKAGLMYDLFTRGVTPSGHLRLPREEAPQLYKESPLGWIPKEWGCEKLVDLLAPVECPMRSGPFGSALLKEELVENGIPLLGIDNIFAERFVAEYQRFVTPHKFVELSRYSVLPGDVIITIMGTVGRCCVVPDGTGKALSSKHLWTMTFDRNKAMPDLICWQLNYAPWVKGWFARQSQGAVMDAIQSSTLRALTLPAPPPNEQKMLQDRYRAIQSDISVEAERMDKLNQLKCGLMQDLLTGRVSIKAAAPSLAVEVAANV